MDRLTTQQQRVLDYIKQHKTDKGYAPSIREIATALKYKSSSTVHTFVSVLEQKGYIRRDPYVDRGLVVIESNQFNLAPTGNPVTLAELEPGSMFIHGSTIAIKSEYHTQQGAVQAYIVGSGEMFWGGTSNYAEQRSLIVQPLKIGEA